MFPSASQALTLIHRYSYTLGTSSLAFHSITKGGEALSSTLSNLRREDGSGPAFLALNDDIASTDPGELKEIDGRMRSWFEEAWATPHPWERKEEKT
jgi:hypothetical protein